MAVIVQFRARALDLRIGRFWCHDIGCARLAERYVQVHLAGVDLDLRLCPAHAAVILHAAEKLDDDRRRR